METVENYVYKKEVDWSLLQDGLTLPMENQVVFGRTMGHFLKRGESKDITLYLYGKSYKAKIYNVNFDEKHHRKKDTFQIRYSKNSDLVKALQGYFITSYQYILNQRQIRAAADRTMIRLPENLKEYMAIYTTEFEDSYLIETISSEDTLELKAAMQGQQERVMETKFNYDVKDSHSTLLESERIVKIRKLNKKIGDNLKLLYGYRCQICGRLIGENYGAHIIEAHHIDYFVNSLNNDANNQLIVCPNHHSIIHDVNPIFYRRRLLYIYSNGIKEGLALNYHLKYF